MKYTLTISCHTHEVTTYVYKSGEGKEVTDILRRVQATGIDDFVRMKAFKVGNFRYFILGETYSLKLVNENNEIVYSREHPESYDQDLTEEDENSLMEYDGFAWRRQADVMFDESVKFKFPPKEYKYLLMELDRYEGTHRYVFNVDEEPDPNSIKFFLCPFRSLHHYDEHATPILLEGVYFEDGEHRCIANRMTTRVIKRTVPDYRRNYIYKHEMPNEYNIILEDIRFDYFDHKRWL